MQRRRENSYRLRVPFLTAVAIQPSHISDWIWSYTAQTICLHCFCFIFDNFTLIYKVLCSYLLLISLPFLLTPSFSQRIPLLLPCLLCVRVQVLSSHSCCVFTIAVAIPYPEDRMHNTPPSSSSYNLSTPWALEGGYRCPVSGEGLRTHCSHHPTTSYQSLH